MIQGLDAALNFADSIVTIYIILMILPYFLRWFLNWVVAVLAFIFRLSHDSYYDKKTKRRRFPRKSNSYYRTRKLRSVIALIALPGTLMRVGIMFLFLRLRGWSLGIRYPGFVGNTDRSLISDRRTGFTFSMSPDKRRRMTFKDIALISLISYIPLYLTYLMWTNRADNLDFIIYIQQGNLSKFWIYVWYYYLLFALLVGGAPIPEETMVPVYYLLGEFPHLFVGILFAYIMGFLLSLMELGEFGFEGKRVGYIYFLLFSAVLVFRILLNQKHMGNLTKSGLDDLLLEMDVIELL